MMNREAFEAIIDNAQKSKTGRMNAVVPVDMIDADPLYQRIEGHNEAKLKKLEKEWDYNLMDSLIIVPHPETNNFFVVDGLGRLMVARRLNIRKLDCVIIAGPEDIDKRRVFEAKYFLRQADCTDKIKPVDKHNARVLSGDPAAVTVENLMKTYQVEIKKTKGRRAMRQLGSYDTAY